MKDLINKYIEDNYLSWAPSTLRSERHRLSSVADVLDGNPINLWKFIESNQAAYTRVTTWTRVTGFYQFLIDNSLIEDKVNKYALFRRKNARLFKHTYNPKKPEITFEEASNRIQLLDVALRPLALQLLGSGERYSEAIQETKDRVVGKGNKPRSVYRPTGSRTSIQSSSTFRRRLKEIGLKPHDLRKLCATKLVELGMNEADLMQVMGWSSITTAKSYLQPKKEELIKGIFDKIHKEVLK